MAKISIIAATYNRSKMLQEAIKSVLDQTYRNFELIIVDDGSTDDTYEVVKSFNSRKIKYIYSDHLGRSVARNKALSVARGKYIAFLDDDDLFLPDKLKKQFEYMEKNDLDMTYTSAFVIYENGDLSPWRHKATQSGHLYSKIAFYKPLTIILPTVMLKRQVVEKVGNFDENMDRFEDTDYWRRVSKFYEIYAISEPLSKVRIHRRNQLEEPSRLLESIDYYVTKVFKEDKDSKLFFKLKGASNIFQYYLGPLLRKKKWHHFAYYFFFKAICYYPLNILAIPLGYLYRQIFGIKETNENTIRILFVAPPESIHTARWISQLADTGWEIHLFSSGFMSSFYREIKNVIIHRPWSLSLGSKNRLIEFKGIHLFLNRALNLLCIFRDLILPNYQIWRLNYLIKKINPNIIHSLEFQSAGHLTYLAKNLNHKDDFPIWVATNWGSDIYWYARFPDELVKIKQILDECDFYSCECTRDVCLAHTYGLKSNVLPVFPNSGGLDLERIEKWRKPLLKRKKIMLKGKYDRWGKLELGLEALKLCAPFLKNYEVVIHSAPERSPVAAIAKAFENETGIKTKVLPQNVHHEEILKLHGSARISIGLSLSDAISTSFLEALAMGSFPIQTNTACADEWIKDGIGGYLVPPENPELIAEKIIKALSDDKFVRSAAESNWRIAKKKLDHKKLKAQTISFYRTVIDFFKEAKKVDDQSIMRNILKVVAKIFFSFWIIFCLFSWLIINTKSIPGDLGFSGKIPPRLEKTITAVENYFDDEFWVRTIVWRTYK